MQWSRLLPLDQRRRLPRLPPPRHSPVTSAQSYRRHHRHPSDSAASMSASLRLEDILAGSESDDEEVGVPMKQQGHKQVSQRAADRCGSTDSLCSAVFTHARSFLMCCFPLYCARSAMLICTPFWLAPTTRTPTATADCLHTSPAAAASASRQQLQRLQQRPSPRQQSLQNPQHRLRLQQQSQRPRQSRRWQQQRQSRAPSLQSRHQRQQRSLQRQ